MAGSGRMFVQLLLWAAATMANAESCARVESHYSVVATHNTLGPWEADLGVVRHGVSPALHFGVRPVSTQNAEAVTVTLRGELPLDSLAPRAEGYELIPGLGEYKVFAQRRTWDEAREICEAEGAHLVVVDNPAEASLLSVLLIAHQLNVTPELHSGFFAKDYATSFVTVLDRPLAESGYGAGWAAGQPDMRVCGRVDLEGLWRDGMCGWEDPASFVCEKSSGVAVPADPHVAFPGPTAAPAAVPAAPRDGTPTGYVTFESHENASLYALHTEPATWREARETCVREGANLAVFDSRGEADVVRKLVTRLESNTPMLPYVFIGARAQINFVTITGEPLSQGRTNLWASNFPAFDNCIVANHNGTLLVTQCWTKYPFICEYKPS